MIGLAFPFIAGWIIIIFANSAPLFYLGRLITGFSGLHSFPTVPICDEQVFRIRILRIPKFFGLPDPLVRSTGPDQDPSIVKQKL